MPQANLVISRSGFIGEETDVIYSKIDDYNYAVLHKDCWPEYVCQHSVDGIISHCKWLGKPFTFMEMKSAKRSYCAKAGRENS